MTRWRTGARVRSMTALSTYADLTRGLDFLREVYEVDLRHPNSVELVAAQAQVFESTASAWLTSARSWFTSNNEEALELAATLPLDSLVAISRAVYKAAPELREPLRTQLARSAQGESPERVRAVAKQKLQETVTAKPTATMTISHEPDVMGMKHAHLRLPESQMDELQARALAVTPLNKNVPVSVRLADGLVKLLAGTSPDYSNHFDRTLVPAFILTVDDSTYVGDGRFATPTARYSPPKTSPTTTSAPTASSASTTPPATSAHTTNSKTSASPPPSCATPSASTKSSAPTPAATNWSFTANSTTPSPGSTAAKPTPTPSSRCVNRTTPKTTTTNPAIRTAGTADTPTPKKPATTRHTAPPGNTTTTPPPTTAGAPSTYYSGRALHLRQRERARRKKDTARRRRRSYRTWLPNDKPS